jgi:hypothetical protein
MDNCPETAVVDIAIVRSVLTWRFVGPAKPDVERVNGAYALRPPSIGLWEGWSDWSRVASVVARFIEPSASESLDPSQSIEIIRFILARIREEMPPSVRMILAHQGARDFLRPKLGLSSTIFCEFADSGHIAVAQVLLKELRD